MASCLFCDIVNNKIQSEKLIENDFDYEIETQRINPISIENNLSIIALVGEKMKSFQGMKRG